MTEVQTAVMVWLRHATPAERVAVFENFCHRCGAELPDYEKQSSWHDAGICGGCAPDPPRDSD